MCGIFGYISNEPIAIDKQKELTEYALKSQSRGPDNTVSKLVSDNVYLVFHRLMINDISSRGNQPLVHPSDENLTLICNGEIYNHKTLCVENNFQPNSGSDCEVILHMYKKFGIKKTVESLDGVFAFVLIDNNTNSIFLARDPIGVRSMYIGNDDDGNFAVASEMKSLYGLVENIQQFRPGYYYEHNDKIYTQYYNYIYSEIITDSEEKIMENIKVLLNKAVEKRLLSDRPIGCLLSGGLDSSLIVALLAQHYPKGELKTFSVGLEGSVDLYYARKVAEHIGSDHHEVVLTEKEMLDYIKKDIYQIETYDTTTIRASTPMLMLSNYIRDNTDISVIFSGEGSDEASGSYMYFHNAPSPEAFKRETVRLMKDLIYYDVLRCDKSTSGAGLEVRVPFLDKEFLEYYMNIPAAFKMPKSYHIEKYLLRKAFDGEDLLPQDVLWRVKEGMSDGVSGKKKGWYEIIQEHVETIMTDNEFETLKQKYTWNCPKSKENMWFREIFNEHYSGCEKTIPYYWLPKWSGDITEPSARVLQCYDIENQ
tara:strand:+ start:5744 stop:7354 length:1611 start_codon:yes stop_codon:yes gene_type:complete